MDSDLFHRRVHPHCRFQRRNLFLLFFRSRSACYERHRYAYLRCREFSGRTCPRLCRYPARQRKDRFCCGICFRKHHDSPSYHDSILPFVMGWGLVGTWCALLLDQCIRASCATVLLHRLQKAGWNKMIEKLA